ncbi:hypothetical protein AUEXF2481DRAFT_27850 [Aureobasidium subglaciale EXF-2481]|uniref:SH3 domain-containing protein n=1 Tax=Aureobasidium subglaciale (strain EXF-2481) TaxID=1043005 RepID=A0A074YKZ4_AURSE|nr:uncharacterized protein AUEXF2481DRAFT_27850 [Aureobasidium subglaciale EXF-2481]KAI5209231.1 hypothetical protein E4T38_02543 [Aureobasidium subglaciale]KAI5228156.1 hypothetical protein E4T40_02322 [Aureobasidium subglaciale]KAI5231456.1 hypothetical protein E4T41_02542 [Aureobasidium subglaciale]KAI5265382.1 hypothetical protein E4T46_02320 [Aureobasidium subglaciale]KEQ96709.1 hypothetical protein AUEXF2481DRAFT_27850 [Aureobasidium subglaciale EXF-2481]
MQNVQRKFGKLMKRSADGADVGGILSEFNTADAALASFIEATKSWRNAWDETLNTQLYVAETLHLLYKPIEVEEDPDNPNQQKPAPTPRRYLDKASDLHSIYANLGKDLSTEINSIEPRLLRPAMDAKDSLKMLKKSIKRREDLKLDYERYNSRADSVRRKETRSAREETALMKHENDLARCSADYQAADEQLKSVLPPVLDALSSLLTDLLAIQIMIQYQLVGQMYTQLHEYCQTHRLPSPSPALEQVVSTFEAEFTPFREDLEHNIRTLSNGKAIHQPMSLPDKEQGTVTGLGLRNNFAKRTGSHGSLPKPSMPGMLRIGSGSGAGSGRSEVEEEAAPVKPPRPGRISSSTRLHSHYENTATLNSQYEDEEAPPVKPPRPGAAPNVDMGSKPRIPSFSKATPVATPDGYTNGGAASRTYSATSTPSSTSTPFLTPSSTRQSQGSDYFSRERKASTSSGTFSVAGKKKPPPPPPKKRIPSSQGQYVTAVYDFGGQGEGDLSFREGDRIKVVKKTGSTDDWWEGEANGMVGSFPANYVKLD